MKKMVLSEADRHYLHARDKRLVAKGYLGRPLSKHQLSSIR